MNDEDEREDSNNSDGLMTARQKILDAQLDDEPEFLGTTGGSQIKKEETKKEIKNKVNSIDFDNNNQEELDDNFGGDISSIMINPLDQNAIQGNQYDNFMEESVQFNK